MRAALIALALWTTSAAAEAPAPPCPVAGDLAVKGMRAGDLRVSDLGVADLRAGDLRVNGARAGDLKAAPSRYAAETEKSLNRTFAAAERASAPVIVDESDALFGKREAAPPATPGPAPDAPSGGCAPPPPPR